MKPRRIKVRVRQWRRQRPPRLRATSLKRRKPRSRYRAARGPPAQ